MELLDGRFDEILDVDFDDAHVEVQQYTENGSAYLRERSSVLGSLSEDGGTI
ncbi:hypothetical protein [Methylobacterium sp. J-070]|uniref:hypothetical protein n=1 Tax=Methylobacterium sp. J-070 TaxID=2836650 RepID=UPI001FB8FA9F|nr:hypothetical protein [Methylobacterium sp. J-070]MCJ2054095.1 hypothetical protein [Methylobacterium sp. J-070]